MIKIAIDGNKHTGLYRCDCECGDHWNGATPRAGVHDWSPAMPISEAIVHMKLVHPDGTLNVVFSERFNSWLHRYWSLNSYADATGVEVGR